LKSSPKIKLLLACGNPLLGDDGVGWKIAEAAEQDPGLADVKVVVRQQFTPELSESLRDADVVAFVDASRTAKPGTVSFSVLAAGQEVPQAFSHHLPPASLLALTAHLYGRIPGRAYAVSVGALPLEPSSGSEEARLEAVLSDPVRAAIPQAVALLREIFV